MIWLYFLVALLFWFSYFVGYLVFGGILITQQLESWAGSPMPTWAVYVGIFVVVVGSFAVHYVIRKLIPGAANFFRFFRGSTSKGVVNSDIKFHELVATYGRRSIIAYLAIASVFITVFGWAFDKYGR